MKAAAAVAEVTVAAEAVAAAADMHSMSKQAGMAAAGAATVAARVWLRWTLTWPCYR